MRDVGGAGRLSDAVTPPSVTDRLPATRRVRLPALRRPGRARRRRATRWSWSAPGPVGLALAIDLAQRGVPVRAARQRRHAVDRLARDLLRQAHARDLRPARLRRAHGRQGRVVERRQGVLPATSRSTSFDLLPETGHERPAFINLQQYYVEGYLAERAPQLPLIDLRWKQQGGRRRAAGRRCATLDDRDARRPLHARTPTTSPPATARAPAVRQLLGQESKGRVFRDRFLIADVHDGRRLPGRALVLVRPAVPSEPERAAAQAARRRLAHRLPARLGRRPRGGEASPRTSCRACARCSAASADGRAVRARMGQRLHLRRAGAWSASATAACCSPATRRTACRRSARAAPTPACRTPRTWRGSSPLVLQRRGAATRCSTATPASASTRPTRTSATRRAPPTSSRPRARSAALFRDAVLELAKRPRLRARAGQQRPAVGAGHACTARRSTRPTPTPSTAAMVPGAPAADAPLARADGSDGWLLRELRRRLHRAGLRRRRRGRRARAARRRRRADAARARAATCARQRRCAHDVEGLRRALRRASRAPSTCCAPTSTSARAGARRRAAGVRAALRPRAGARHR